MTASLLRRARAGTPTPRALVGKILGGTQDTGEMVCVQPGYLCEAGIVSESGSSDPCICPTQGESQITAAFVAHDRDPINVWCPFIFVRPDSVVFYIQLDQGDCGGSGSASGTIEDGSDPQPAAFAADSGSDSGSTGLCDDSTSRYGIISAEQSATCVMTPKKIECCPDGSPKITEWYMRQVIGIELDDCIDPCPESGSG